MFRHDDKESTQLEFALTIGFDMETNTNVQVSMSEKFLVDRISTICGGCTLIDGVGFWKEDGAHHKETFTGELKQETVIQILVTSEKTKAQTTYETLKESVKEVKEKFGLNIEWIHCPVKEIYRAHFKV